MKYFYKFSSNFNIGESEGYLVKTREDIIILIYDANYLLDIYIQSSELTLRIFSTYLDNAREHAYFTNLYMK